MFKATKQICNGAKLSYPVENDLKINGSCRDCNKLQGEFGIIAILHFFQQDNTKNVIRSSASVG